MVNNLSKETISRDFSPHIITGKHLKRCKAKIIAFLLLRQGPENSTRYLLEKKGQCRAYFFLCGMGGGFRVIFLELSLWDGDFSLKVGLWVGGDDPGHLGGAVVRQAAVKRLVEGRKKTCIRVTAHFRVMDRGHRQNTEHTGPTAWSSAILGSVWTFWESSLGPLILWESGHGWGVC